MCECDNRVPGKSRQQRHEEHVADAEIEKCSGVGEGSKLGGVEKRRRGEQRRHSLHDRRW